jgi:hypothetical protein
MVVQRGVVLPRAAVALGADSLKDLVEDRWFGVTQCVQMETNRSGRGVEN